LDDFESRMKPPGGCKTKGPLLAALVGTLLIVFSVARASGRSKRKRAGGRYGSKAAAGAAGGDRLEEMKPKELESWRARLTAIERELEEKLSHTDEEARPVSPDSALGRLTRLDAMQSQQMRLALRQADEVRLRRIKQALRFVDEGRYGICVKCGEEIGEKRLSVVPESVLCIHCAR
jgi:DnaK suppressor protein